MHLQSCVAVCWILTFLSFILSLLVLTSGSKPGYLEDAAIVFISDLQSDQYINAFQPLYSIDLRNPLFNSTSSWASIHYLTTCLGNYTLSGSKTDTTCFSNPSPENLFNLHRAFIPWVIGIAFTGLDLVLLGLLFGGRRHWNGWMMMFLILAFTPLVLGAILSTIFSYTEYDGAKAGPLFVPLTWTAVAAVFVGSFVHSFEYSLQRWTPTGEVIAAKHKPAKVPWMAMDRYYWTNPR